MSEPAPSPLKRAVSWKEASPALLFIAGLAIAALYSMTLGLLLVGPVLLYLAVAFWRIPREQRARLDAVLEAQDRAPFGRMHRIIELATLFYLAAVAAQWLLRRL